MTKHLPTSPNVRHLKNQSKQLLKLWLLFDPASITQLRVLHPSFQNLTPDQLVSKMNLHNAQLSIARSYGFQNWESLCSCVGAMAHADLSALTPDQVFALLSRSGNESPANANLIVANTEKLKNYEKGRPRRENGGIILTEKQGLTLEEAHNDRAKLHGMPPIGTAFTNQYGIEWKVESYAFFTTPTTFARYPGDCDYLPIVEPQNISQRLRSFISEVDRCTSKWVLFLDTMPAAHPLRLGHHIHCAHLSADPEEAHLFLDVQNLHETTFAHELAHLWISFVEDGDGGRVLRDRSDKGKVNQLDFLQSFVLDIKVNDLIEQRGFDMTLISQDQIDGIEALRGAIMLGHKPPTRREMLLYCLQIAAIVLEHRRWPKQMQVRLPSMLDFFEATVPEIYFMAMEFVDIVSGHGVDSKDAVRDTLDECISLGFQFTGDDFALSEDLEEITLAECMQDKFPQEFAGMPVALKLEVNKARARHGILGDGKVSLSVSPSGMALLVFEDTSGNRTGPIPVNYRLAAPPLDFNTIHLQRKRQPWEFSKAISGQAGRMQVDLAAPQKHFPLAKRPIISVQDDFGQLLGDPSRNNCFPIGQAPVSRMQDMANGQQFDGLEVPQIPYTSQVRRYMAGVALSVAQTRLAQQVAMSSTNLYLYAHNNPILYTDASGLDVRIGPVPPGTSCDGANAVTWCNYDAGKPYTLICNGKCDAPCTDAHEGQHRHDHASCCKRLLNCYKTQSKAVCQARYERWAATNKKWRECRAYHVGLTCRAKMIGKRDCWHCAPGNSCCDHLKDAWQNDNDQIGVYCNGVNPWQSAPARCPF